MTIAICYRLLVYIPTEYQMILNTSWNEESLTFSDYELSKDKL